MISISTVLFLVALGLIIWFWLAQLKAKEIAIHFAKSQCKLHNQQFLDGTTSFKKIGFRRDKDGHLKLLRTYNYDYFDGHERITSSISLLGLVVQTKNNVIEFPWKPKDNH